MAQTIGSRIREIRAQRGIKQSELAGIIGISPTYLNLIEHDKRTVAGKILSQIAEALSVERTQLLRGATAEIIEKLQQAARQMTSHQQAPESARRGDIVGAELDEIELFTTRFPGWANVLAYQATSNRHLEALIEALSDRLSHDPVLSETIHIMLSNITAIRSISELLVVRGSMTETQQKSFIQNIFLESKRLSTTAEKLLEQFDPAYSKASGETARNWPTDNHNNQQSSSYDSEADKKAGPDKQAGSALLPEAIANAPAFLQAQKIVTLETLKQSESQHFFQPFLIADYFDIPAYFLFYHLLTLSGQGGLPDYGLLEVDNAGGVLYRHEIGTMRLPSRSGACPRWPVYRALGTKGEPVLQQMQFITGETYQAYAISKTRKRTYSQLAPVSQSVMLFHQTGDDRHHKLAPPVVDVGFHCSVCNRTDCPDRREVYALLGDER